ncbi:MAG: HEAT repeat domain-containing protein [Actinomycetota bacterium]
MAPEDPTAHGGYEDVEAQFLEASRRLNHGVPRYRRRAVMELCEHGVRSVPLLSRALLDSELSVREMAAEALGRTGLPEALTPLCDALKSSDLPTRAAAARALGELGDERALSSLVDTLRACFIRGSGRAQRRLGLAVAPVLACCAALNFWIIVSGAGELKALFLALFFAATGWNVYAGKRRAHNAVCADVADAIAKLGACHPSPHLRSLAPELRAVAGDVVLHDRAARRSARDAAARIEALTADCSRLPLAASPPVADPLALPLISGVPGGEGPSKLDRS